MAKPKTIDKRDQERMACRRDKRGKRAVRIASATNKTE